MKMIVLLAAVLTTGLLACGPADSGNREYVQADLYVRYLSEDGKYTAEATLSRRDSTRGLDTVYQSPGGVAFMGSNLKAASRSESAQRYRETIAAQADARPRFTFQLANGSQYEAVGTLAPFDTLIMGPLPTHNFGFTVYPGNERDTLGPNEMLTALFVSDEGQAYSGTLLGPTRPSDGYAFPRNSVAVWPLGQGTLSFIRRRATPLSADGLRGELVEEVYSKARPSAVVN